MTVHIPPWLRKDGHDVERKLVWQGDSSEILHEGTLEPVRQPHRLLTLSVHVVEVGDWLPTYGVLPMGLPVLWNALFLYVPSLRERPTNLTDKVHFRYLKMLSLSLYFFNLLPLPFLDGGQLFDVLYDWRTSGPGDPADGETLMLDQLEAAPLEAERISPPPNRSFGAARQKAWWRRVVHVSVGTLTGCCILLSFMKTL